MLTLPRSTNNHSTVISTSDDPTTHRFPRPSLSLYPSDDDSIYETQPQPRRPAKHRLGDRQHGQRPLDLSTPHWWRDRSIIPCQQIRDGFGAEMNKLTRRTEKLEYGIAKKDQEIQGLKNTHASTLTALTTESERVLELQRAKIKTLERDNAHLSKKLCKKSKQVKKLKKLLFTDSDSSST